MTQERIIGGCVLNPQGVLSVRRVPKEKKDVRQRQKLVDAIRRKELRAAEQAKAFAAPNAVAHVKQGGGIPATAPIRQTEADIKKKLAQPSSFSFNNVLNVKK